MDFDTIIAVDGGVNGAIVAYRKKEIKSYHIPKTTEEMKNLLGYYAEISINPIMFIEKVNTWNNENRFMQHAIEKLGKANKQLSTVAELLGIKVIEVNARTWQKEMTKQKKNDYTDRKQMFKAIATQLYSKKNIKVTLSNADALLILQYVGNDIKNNALWIRKEIHIEKKLKL